MADDIRYGFRRVIPILTCVTVATVWDKWFDDLFRDLVSTKIQVQHPGLAAVANRLRLGCLRYLGKPRGA